MFFPSYKDTDNLLTSLSFRQPKLRFWNPGLVRPGLHCPVWLLST